MIATKEYMQKLCNKFDVIIFTARQAPTEAFIQWYNDWKEHNAGEIQLSRFDVLSVLDYFDEDLQKLWEGEGEE